MEFSTWLADLSQLGGKDPLSNFEGSSFGQVDLSRAHPSGLAQLASNRVSTISNLVRDGVAFSRSSSAARRIRNKTKRVRESFGIETCFIAGGLVAIGERALPILLWPTNLIPKGDDFEVRLGDKPVLNPWLVDVIRAERQDFHEQDLLALAASEPDLIPVSVLTLVAEFLSGTSAEIEKLLVLGNFVPDLKYTKNAILDKLPEFAPVQTIASEPVLVANADAHQRAVMQAALAGNSVVVQTLPGTGYIQTVLNLLANLALNGKRTLLIAPREQTVDEIAERLGQLSLAGLAIRNTDVWADAVAAISRHEKAPTADLASAKNRLASAEAAVAEYFAAVSSTENPLQVSLTQALTKLADLAVATIPPTNSARVRSELLPELKDSGPNLIARAHQAGVFRFGPQDTPWYGARFTNPADIATAIRTAKELAGEEFRTLSYQISRYLADQKLAPCNSVEQWAAQLMLLLGIRETLDRFQPAIYDRPLTEMIAATAPRGERGDLSGAQRRRFKKLAKEYLRPGASVPNLHEALIAAEAQRVMWLEQNQTQAPPTVPLGLNDVQQKFQRVHSALELLQRHLSADPDIELLTRLSFEDLALKLQDLATKTEILDQLLERAPLLAELEQAGLSSLTKELCELSPSLERAQSEFELCWWQSALEAVVADNPTILNFSAERVAQVEAEYESAAQDLVAQGLAHVKAALAGNWFAAIKAHPAGADELRAQLRARVISLRSATKAGRVWEALAPAVICSPLRVHEVPVGEFDVLIALDGAFMGVAESLPALQRVKQLVVFGDPTISAPENFDTVARANQGYVESERESIYDFAASRFEVLRLQNSYRTEGQVLGTYLNQNFYQGALHIEPTASQFRGESNFEQIQITEGDVAPSTIEGATESLDAEVQRVVELVINHARWSPAESLMVVSPSRSHADRIASGVQQQVLQQPQLAEYFDAHGREKFEVLTMSEITHRIADRVIFSVGFGRTPQGRISQTLGDFNSEHAGRWLVNQIASARNHLTVVSCYNFEDFAGGSLPENQRWLKDLIAPSFLSEAKSGEPDPLLKDLALRLQKLGVRAELNFAGRIPLAISFSNRVAAVDPDWALHGADWDEKLRLRPGLLRAMGWEYLRVHALEIFAKPQDVALRIAKQLGVEVETKRQPLFDPPAFEDTARAWGDPDDSNDDRLRDDRPPHWG